MQWQWCYYYENTVTVSQRSSRNKTSCTKLWEPWKIFQCFPNPAIFFNLKYFFLLCFPCLVLIHLSPSPHCCAFPLLLPEAASSALLVLLKWSLCMQVHKLEACSLFLHCSCAGWLLWGRASVQGRCHFWFSERSVESIYVNGWQEVFRFRCLGAGWREKHPDTGRGQGAELQGERHYLNVTVLLLSLSIFWVVQTRIISCFFSLTLGINLPGDWASSELLNLGERCQPSTASLLCLIYIFPQALPGGVPSGILKWQIGAEGLGTLLCNTLTSLHGRPRSHGCPVASRSELKCCCWGWGAGPRGVGEGEAAPLPACLAPCPRISPRAAGLFLQVLVTTVMPVTAGGYWPWIFVCCFCIFKIT